MTGFPEVLRSPGPTSVAGSQVLSTFEKSIGISLVEKHELQILVPDKEGLHSTVECQDLKTLAE